MADRQQPELKFHWDSNAAQAMNGDSKSPGNPPFSVHPPLGATPSTREVFEALIEWELSSGPMDRRRRRRLAQYATQLGLSAVLTGDYMSRLQRDIPSCRSPESSLRISPESDESRL